ncbi:MFS transporter [Thiolapillus brandeum]|uniref:MFS transporter, UMF1 family n=1 Tax=Thiolapillus brandeum TaxID=1076588 RepID=A0A7U6GI46_9GAMM|nr:MFS transporter [Thiolapillus brandeum]BAO44027.1 MFS transporter, UMF1 family [Thiolapillus brandeum]
MNRRSRMSWALYDWGNSAFATTVMAGFFPVFFKEYWASGLSATDSTFWLGVGNSAASTLMVLFAPLIGALADQGNRKKHYLLLFAFLGALMTSSLFMMASGMWQIALLFYALGIIGFSGSIIPYDALLVDVAEEEELDKVSALGYAMGYLGGGLLFAVNVFMVLKPGYFGLENPGQAVRVSFLMVGIWWALFSIPVMLFVHERIPRPVNPHALRGALGEIRENFREVGRYRRAALFLLAYWLYIDGVDTIVRMAVDYGLAIGFESSDLLTALLITQFVGFPAALAFGYVGERYGPKKGIMIALAVYILIVFWAWRMQAAWEFYALAVVIGLVQGGIQSLSRSLYARLIPRDRAGMFYGVYNMLGKFAAVIGPLLVGVVAAASGDSRLGILAVLLLFVAGFVVLQRVTVKE